MKTICRGCKKKFKFNGQAYGFCNDKCRKQHMKKHCKPSHLSGILTKELNRISDEVI